MYACMRMFAIRIVALAAPMVLAIQIAVPAVLTANATPPSKRGRCQQQYYTAVGIIVGHRNRSEKIAKYYVDFYL